MWQQVQQLTHPVHAGLKLEGVEPLASPDDCLLAEQIAKEDPQVQEQLKLRGVTNIDLVACDPWSGWHLCPQIARMQ